jgi:predicted ATPase
MTSSVDSERLAVRWRNFRSFKDTGWISLRPLTVLVGSNNSGKTSLMAPLLLLKQSLDARDPAQSLTLVGDLVDAGAYRDIVFQHETSRRVSFGLRWRHRELAGTRDPKPVGAYPPGELEVRFAPTSPRSREVALDRYAIRDVFGRPFITRTKTSTGRYSLINHTVASNAEGTSKAARTRINAFRRAARKDHPDFFLFDPRDVLDVFFKQSTKAKTSGTSIDVEVPGEAAYYYSALTHVQNRVGELLDGVSYIGPLRDWPKRLYTLSGEAPADVGIRGQDAPEILYRDPSLAKRASTWLRRLHLAQSIRCHSVGGEAFRVVLHRAASSPDINFADCGFGLSQVLPLVVEAVHGRDHAITIAEQPEIHLNPGMQLRLADVFVEIVAQGRSAIVETHSEHLVLNLRRLVAEGKLQSTDIALYYVEKQGDSSRVREVPIQENGHVLANDWPRGFFGEAFTTSMALASAQARRSRAR